MKLLPKLLAKTPILAAVSAPSSLAVDYAKELGITLFGFVEMAEQNFIQIQHVCIQSKQDFL